VDQGGPRELAEPAFVGRLRERALLRHLLRDAAAGRPAIVVVAGVPGSGKTALLRWSAAEAGAAGAFVLRTVGSEGSVPLAALRRLVAPLPELAAVLGDPPPSEPTDATRGADGPQHLADALAEAVVTRARRRQVVVIVDDAHDLERSSEAVLDGFLTTIDDLGARGPLALMVIVAVRDPTQPGGLADRALRLGSARSVPVGGLDADDVHELVARAGLRPHPRLVGDLLADTGGLPLLVQAAIARQTTPGGGEGPRVRSIADALRLRFERLDPAGLEVLRMAAVLGEPWTASELAVAGGHDRARVDGVVRDAIDAQVVRRSRDGLWFTHPLLRTELLDDLDDDHIRALHRSVADGLLGTGVGGDAELVRAADHLLRSRPTGPGTRDRVVAPDVADVCRRAGQVTDRWGAWRQTARFLAAAADWADSGDGSDDEIGGTAGDLYLAAGRAAYLDHDHAQAEVLLARALACARRHRDRDLGLEAAVYLARSRAGARFRLGHRVELGELEATLAEAADASQATDAGVAGIVRAEAALAEALIVSVESEQAFALVDDARRRAAAAPGGTAALAGPLARADFAEGIHRLHHLDLAEADDCFRAGRRRAEAAGDALTALYVRSRLAVSALAQGAVGAARADAAAIEAEAIERGFAGEAGLAAAQQAVGYALVGTDAAAEAAQRAHRVWRSTDFTYITALLAPVLVAIDARTQGVGQAPAPLPTSSAVTALAAVEANDVEGARVRAQTARWRHGFRGRVNQANEAVAAALVEVGDLIGDPALVAAGGGAVTELGERGVQVMLGWPTTVPRLAAVVARHAGDLVAARRRLDHAIALCDREELAAERAKVLLEMGRTEAAAGAQTVGVAALFAEAVRAFAGEAMHGWVARADALAQALGFSVLDAHGSSRECTIFTDDIVGSTASNVRLGDALYVEQLRVHDGLVRARLREYGGREIKHTGDGVNAAFADATDAVRCALAIQADIDAWHRSEPDLALQVRIGLAHGPVIPMAGDFFGLVQSQAARLCALASPGGLLVTGPVAGRLTAADVAIEPLGPHDLKGMPDAVEIYRLTAA
jgi:class 3 adenylate cyclase